MKHLTLFNNNSEFSAATLATPNVSYLIEENQVIYTPGAPMITVKFEDQYVLWGNPEFTYDNASEGQTYQVPEGSILRDLMEMIHYDYSDTNHFPTRSTWYWEGPFLEDSGEIVNYDENGRKEGTLSYFLDKPLYEGSYVWFGYA